jgi:hypothetical protein
MVSDDPDESQSPDESQRRDGPYRADGSGDAGEPQKADHYRHRDGTDEIVFAVEEGHVLSVREYGSVDDFERAVADAEHVGTHEGVADLPGVEAFEDEGGDGTHE